MNSPRGLNTWTSSPLRFIEDDLYLILSQGRESTFLSTGSPLEHVPCGANVGFVLYSLSAFCGFKPDLTFPR